MRSSERQRIAFSSALMAFRGHQAYNLENARLSGARGREWAGGTMARPIRIQYPGAVYHVMARGNQGGGVFRDAPDRQTFLASLGEACAKTGWRIHA
jgi:hypothetical protein